jgi:hypothetical protein
VEWKKVKFMEERVGEDFDALIISTAKYGLFVELTELFIEGLVPIDTLPGDQYTYQENVRKIVGGAPAASFPSATRCGWCSIAWTEPNASCNSRFSKMTPNDLVLIPAASFSWARKTGAMKSARCIE